MILGILLLGVTALSLVLLSRQLLLQNVLIIATIIAVASTCLEAVAAQFGYPAHSAKIMNSTALLLPGSIPSFLPFVWIPMTIFTRMAVKSLIQSQTRCRGLIIWLVSGLTLALLLFIIEERCTGIFQPQLFPRLCAIAYAVLICVVPWMLDKRSAFVNAPEGTSPSA